MGARYRALANARARSVAAPIANRDPQKAAARRLTFLHIESRGRAALNAILDDIELVIACFIVACCQFRGPGVIAYLRLHEIRREPALDPIKDQPRLAVAATKLIRQTGLVVTDLRWDAP